MKGQNGTPVATHIQQRRIDSGAMGYEMLANSLVNNYTIGDVRIIERLINLVKNGKIDGTKYRLQLFGGLSEKITLSEILESKEKYLSLVICSNGFNNRVMEILEN